MAKEVDVVIYSAPGLVPDGLRRVALVPGPLVAARQWAVTTYSSPALVPARRLVVGGVKYASANLVPPNLQIVTLADLSWTSPTITPATTGGNLIVNGDFANWTADNPDNWTVSGESGADPMVTQVTGKARIYSSSVSILLSQTPLTAGNLYACSLDVIARVSGTIQQADAGGAFPYFTIPTGIATQSWTMWAVGTSWLLKRLATPTDITIDNVVCTQLTFASLLGPLQVAGLSGTWICEPSLAIGTQCGMLLNWDGQVASANFVAVFLNRQSTGQVEVRSYKCVNGVLSQIIADAGGLSYVQRAPLQVTATGTSYAVSYNGTPITGSPATVSDASVIGQSGMCALSTAAGNTPGQMLYRGA